VRGTGVGDGYGVCTDRERAARMLWRFSTHGAGVAF